MGTKVKGLLKGLRYISQIFDPKEEEKEMQIGYPTDVKHVAHIGSEGSSTGLPSWMKDVKPGSDDSHVVSATIQQKNTSETSQEVTSSPRRRSGRHRASDSAASLSNSSSGAARHARRHQSTSGSTGSSGNDSPKASRKPKHRTGNAGESDGNDSPRNQHQQEGPAVPKHRRRKPKSAEGSTKPKGTVKPAAVEEEL